MRPTWAHRATECAYKKCLAKDKLILPQHRRLDESIWTGEKTRRLHYHLKCYAKYVIQWFIDNPYKPRSSMGGRPPLEMSETDKKLRRLTLGKLNALKTYYIPLLKLQVDITELESRDMKRFMQFHRKMQENLKVLEGVGGIPEIYKNMAVPTLGGLGTPVTSEKEEILA